MNVNQQARYSGCWTERSSRFLRVFTCNHCRFSATGRAGPGSGNALATFAKLRGQMMKHAREVHPDRLDDSQEKARERGRAARRAEVNVCHNPEPYYVSAWSDGWDRENRAINAAKEPSKVTRLRVRVTPDRLPQVTIYRGDEVVGTGNYGGPLGLVNPGPGWDLSDEEWLEANREVGKWHRSQKGASS